MVTPDPKVSQGAQTIQKGSSTSQGAGFDALVHRGLVDPPLILADQSSIVIRPANGKRRNPETVNPGRTEISSPGYTEPRSGDCSSGTVLSAVDVPADITHVSGVSGPESILRVDENNKNVTE